ncbi:MAG: hypothetical protein U1E65_18045 [Myxococcota bacterium]
MELDRLRRAQVCLIVSLATGFGCASSEVADKDAAPTDSGAHNPDALAADAGFADAAEVDLGFADAAEVDLGFADAAEVDLGFADGAEADAGLADAAEVDAGFADAAEVDLGFADAAEADAGFADAAEADAGFADAGPADPSCVSAPDAQVPPTPGLFERANASLGFSGTQGQCGWHYGYQTPTATTGFQRMTEWDPSGVWLTNAATLWTQIQRDLAHPNGIMTSGGRQPLDQWAIRRWQSDVQGLVHITGAASKTAAGGNGVDVRVMVDGVQAYAQYIGAGDTIGVRFTLSATVAVGSAIDLVLDPHASDDLVDSTRTELQVWQ